MEQNYWFKSDVCQTKFNSNFNEVQKYHTIAGRTGSLEFPVVLPYSNLVDVKIADLNIYETEFPEILLLISNGDSLEPISNRRS